AVFTSLGYKSLRTHLVQGGTYRMQPDVFYIREVVVTAQENHGLTSATKIGQDAISHIQPSSVADLLELLPGGVSRDPSFGSPKVVNLRAAGSLSEDYITSALGTRFTIDGKPVFNDANLQYTPAFSNLGSDFVNLGTDMRTIPTEDIESMDVVRGIASVEHGDLTSGLIQIKRRRGGNDIRLRFKSDMSSKLFYAGKGWEWGGSEKRTVNVGANYLDSHSDPRNLRQNYKRLTVSLRGSRTWNSNEKFHSILTANLDYTGSFDDQKSDKDLDEFDGIPAETYKSTNNHIDLGADWTLSAKSDESIFRTMVLTASLSYGNDVIDRWKNVILTSEEPISVSRVPGEFDAIMVPTRYQATLIVDGKPFYAYLRAVSRWRLLGQNIMAGAEWTFDKNFGDGSVFDVMRPFSTGTSTRPRAYKEIPADSNLAFFAEENGKAALGGFGLEWSAGIRAGFMPGMSRDYALSGKFAIDPRANLRLNFPRP
ncbi:MAG: TonB-dependent receptor plug domain-containing protein, partial [Bacteroidales bacterium]|nr:TonB-dependent receptor plug domain-containing protein [Bacteroidales bacterium]